MKRAVLDRAALTAPRRTAHPRGVFRATRDAAPRAADPNSRVRRFVFSDGTVDRYGDTIDPRGWVLDNYVRNPVILFGHDPSQVENVIGRCCAGSPFVQDGQLVGDVEFMPAAVNPKAETVLQMVDAGFLKTGSVGFQPLEFSFSADKNRKGGIDFTRQELLEYSIVPIPANPNALQLAKDAGLDVESVRALLREAAEWKCGAATDLPIAQTDTWDGPAAAERILAAAGFDGDSPDGAKARRGFLVYDASAPANKGSYKLPFADIVGGALKATTAGIKAAAARLPQADIPADVKDAAGKVLDGYEQKAGIGAGKAMRAFGPVVARDLYDVAWLAEILKQLFYLQGLVAAEAADEGDGSAVPAMMADALKALGNVLIAMTSEEVEEEIDGTETNTGPFPPDGAPLTATLKSALFAMLRHAAGRAATARAARDLAALDPSSLAALLRHGNPGPAARAALADLIEAGGLVAKAGRVISAANEAALRQAHEHMNSAVACVRGVLDQVGDDGDVDPDDGSDGDGDDAAQNDDEEKAAERQRRARVMELAAE